MIKARERACQCMAGKEEVVLVGTVLKGIFPNRQFRRVKVEVYYCINCNSSWKINARKNV